MVALNVTVGFGTIVICVTDLAGTEVVQPGDCGFAVKLNVTVPDSFAPEV